MDSYSIMEEVGHGSFGSVWRAVHKDSGEVVAIKSLKETYSSWEECLNLQEVKSLRSMDHPNIMKLKDVIREDNGSVYFVLEYMECNLYDLVQSKQDPFSEDQVRKWCFQIFQGLAHMHHRGYFHRDLKLENLLVTKDLNIKIADLGLATEIHPPYTKYDSTLWYRAPEVMLGSQFYNGPKVDMWAMGAIMYEIFSRRPLFPAGATSEADEMIEICSVIGTPTKDSWADGFRLARNINYRFPNFSKEDDRLSSLIPWASDAAISLIRSLCSWDPFKRPTAADALRHPFFRSCSHSVIPRTPIGPKSRTANKTGEALKKHKYQAQPFSLIEQDNWFLPAPLHPCSMKAGVQWVGESRNLYLKTVQEIQSGI